MDFCNQTIRDRLKSLFYKDFARWKTLMEDLITLHDPNLWIYVTQPYEKPRIAGSTFFKTVNQMSATERANFALEKKTFEILLACLPYDEASCMKTQETSFYLWDSLNVSYGTNLRVTSSDEGMKEELMKKEDEINALESHILTLENEREEMKLKISELMKRDEDLKVIQTQVLNMENEREELRLKVSRMEEEILEFESQQKVLTRLQEDHELALKTIQDLRERLSEPEKVVKKVYECKSSCEKNNSSCLKNNSSCQKNTSSCEKRKFSQFTNYSLQKNKKCLKCFGIIQSTNSSNHQKVDCRDNSGHFKYDKSSASTSPKKTGVFIPTLQPELRRTKSYAYTREQMLAFAPPRFHHTVQNRRKDFVPFSCRTSVRRNEFRNETRCLNFRWNSMSLDLIDESYRKVSKISRKIGTVLKWVPKVKV